MSLIFQALTPSVAPKESLRPRLKKIKEIKMPGPDPFGIWYDESATGQPIVVAEIWGSRNRPYFDGNPKHRNARAAAVLRRLRRDGWTCAECGEPVPMFRRADADYCREACRKKAARRRRSKEATS